MKKSILALLLAVLMAASLLPAAALADGPAENDVAAYTNSQNVTTYYTTVGAALSAANAGGGGTIKLLGNAELKHDDTNSYLDKREYPGYGWCVYVRADLILDLGGFTLTCNEFYGIAVNPEISLTIDNGTYVHSHSSIVSHALEAVKNTNYGPGSTITIGKDAIIEADHDAVLSQGYSTINVYGKIDCGAYAIYGMGPANAVNVEGASIKTDYYAIFQDPYTTELPNVREYSTYTIKNSTIIAGDEFAAISIRNNAGTFTDNHKLTIENSDISAGIGAFVSYTDVTISGENTKIEYTNTAGNSIYFNHEGQGTVGSLTINAGKIVGPIGVKEPAGGAGNQATISVNGGYFTEPVDVSYLSNKFQYMLYTDPYYSYYETLDDALEVAEQGSTITNLNTGDVLTVFAVTVAPNNGQAATTTLVLEGKTITLPAEPTLDGYAFLGWSDGRTTYKAGYEYTVNKDTIITALWKEEYNVVYIYNNGAAAGHETVLKGESVTLPTPSKSGYAFLGWACSDGNVYDGGDKVAIWGNTTFEATWVRHPDTPYVPEPEEPVTPDVPTFPFYDVSTSAWYYSAVKYVYDNKLMDGVDTYTFAPNDTLTRAMVWTIIARMSGVDTTGGNSWYAKAQEWVITNGISDGENPTAAITRQELVTMLYRYAQIKGYDVSVGESTNILSYVDATSISEYAMSAFQWACGSGLTEGDENGALTPLATATRAQAAAMIMRFCESVK